jgi:hypothetical protein
MDANDPSILGNGRTSRWTDHRIPVKFVAVLTILFGLWLIALDVVVGMPSFWVISEGPSLFILYCVVFWLAGRVPTERK